MTTLVNVITVQAPIEKIWRALSNIEELEKYDPTVKKSTAISTMRSGAGAARKVNMKDGKNWFEEKCTLWKPEEALTYELTACSFPVHGLRHSYSFEQKGNSVRVTQVMEYQVKFGLLGKFLDVIMIRKQTDSGVKKFFSGFKSYVENIR
jgi:ribosome-associated toxin RatA of RatAB toxin-antitoxin module